MPIVAINIKQKKYIYVDDKSEKKSIIDKMEINNKKKKLMLLKFFFKL
jgi:hypothetical protein